MTSVKQAGFIRVPEFCPAGWRYVSPEEALADLLAHLQSMHAEGLLDMQMLQALYDLGTRIAEERDYPILQAIADSWAVL